MKQVVRRFLLLAAALMLISTGAPAYYHWIFFATPGGPYQPIPARFDLGALTDQTVHYFISDVGPSTLMPGDSRTAIYRQIQEAAAVWNRAGSSALRLRFGGIANIATPQTAPGIDVVFDDEMPPGVLALAKPSFPADMSFLSEEGTKFVPLLRSRLQLRRDLTIPGLEQASYSDAFFLTLVHEFGHTLGLQHTLTSAAMSTAVTRATRKGSPLSADDIAGISLLYPAPAYQAATGTIAGRVTLDGAGVNLASVVALSPMGTAVSALTNPDGTYAIAGLPPGQYYVYVHPLPPALVGQSHPADLDPPTGIDQQSYPANLGFDTRFYPGTRDWTQATLFDLAAGASVENIDFEVEPRPGPRIHSMTTYGYQDGIPVSQPPLAAQTRQWLVFYAEGITVNNRTAIAPGLGVSVIGGAAHAESETLAYHAQGYLRVVIATEGVDSGTPAALAVTLGDDLYVLPAAFSVEPSGPPSISGIAPAPAEEGSSGADSGNVIVTGTNLTAQTRILFDGAPGKNVAISGDGALIVTPPPAPSAHTAIMEAVNPDGQTSLQALDPAHLLTFAYPVRDDAFISVDTYSLTAGTDAFVSITGSNTHFSTDQTRVGFGSSDIAVRQLWVIDATHLLMNVTVQSGAAVQPVSVTVSTGLELVTLPAGIQITGAFDPQVSLRVPIVNLDTGLAGVPAGGTAQIRTTGLPSEREGWTLSIGGQAVPFQVDDHGVITAQVPSDLGVGPQIVELQALQALAAPRVLLQIDPPPPSIVSAFDNSAANGSGLPVTWLTPAKGGDTITLTVEGLSGADDIWLAVYGDMMPPLSVSPGEGTATLVQFRLPDHLVYNPNASTQVLPVRVGAGTRLSAAFPLNIYVEVVLNTSSDASAEKASGR